MHLMTVKQPLHSAKKNVETPEIFEKPILQNFEKNEKLDKL